MESHAGQQDLRPHWGEDRAAREESSSFAGEQLRFLWIHPVTMGPFVKKGQDRKLSLHSMNYLVQNASVIRGENSDGSCSRKEAFDTTYNIVTREMV